MKESLEELFKMPRYLLGEGYDSALQFINHLKPLEILEFPSGTELGTWTVPDEWVVRDAWVEFNGERILDYKTQPLSLVVGSLPFEGEVTHEEFAKHLHHGDTDATPYVFKYYDKDWGFAVPKDFAVVEGLYTVHIDTEYKSGIMKLGVHTIKGTSDREILLFAHLDHPFQANDNLSGVICLLDVASRIKCDHTIKIIFCPETIGSQAYALTQDLSKVDFVIAVDICGNDGPILLQSAFDQTARINKVAHVTIQGMGTGFVKGKFRTTIGSDEYPFNDPAIGIPGILLSRHPYPEYHQSTDTPDKIAYDRITAMGDVILKIVENYESDFIPVKNFSGPVMRSRYNIQTPSPQLNLSYDYLFYSIDGKRFVSELCYDFGTNFAYTLLALNKLKDDKFITNCGVDSCKESVKQASKQKHEGLQGKANVSRKRRKVS